MSPPESPPAPTDIEMGESVTGVVSLMLGAEECCSEWAPVLLLPLAPSCSNVTSDRQKHSHTRYTFAWVEKGNCRHIGRYSQNVTKLETANFSHPFYGTPCVNTFITFE